MYRILFCVICASHVYLDLSFAWFSPLLNKSGDPEGWEDRHLEFQAVWPALAVLMKRQLLHDEVMVEMVRYCHFIDCCLPFVGST